MRVLLANDASGHSRVATNYLAAIPFREPIDVDVVSALVPPLIVDPGMGGMPLELSVFMDEELAAVRKRADEEAEALKKAAGVNRLHTVHTHVPIGSPSSELLQLAKDTRAELIVMGAVGHSSLDRVLLGSTSDCVATHSDTSTLVVRPQHNPDSPPTIGKILIALSGPPYDQPIVDWLGQLNLGPNVQVHLVRILRLNTFYRQDIRERASLSWTSYVRNAERQILDVETQLQSTGLNTEAHLVEGSHIGEAITRYAESRGCDLVVTGDNESGLLTRVFMGSTSRYVLRHASCSVLTVRDKNDRVEVKEAVAAAASLHPILV